MSHDNDGVVWLTVPDALSHLKVSKTMLYSAMKDGRLPFYYIKGTRQRRIKQSDLDGLLERGIPEELESLDDTE
jgi:excisionase family DNA binding protein